MSYYDWRDNEIKVGSRIIYVLSKSTTVELVEAIVIDIEPIEYKTNWGRKNRSFYLTVQPKKRLKSGTTYENDEPSQKITAVERVTVI